MKERGGVLPHRERIKRLFLREQIDRIPCFSGMGHITISGLRENGLKFCELHNNPEKMAKAAASSYKLYDYECAVIPFDVCLEAEILGCKINFYEKDYPEAILYPTVEEKIGEEKVIIPKHLEDRGRMGVIREALYLLREDLTVEVPIGAYFLGPFTLAGQIMEREDFLKMILKRPQKAHYLLQLLTDFLIEIVETLAGSDLDYVTIREMGATSDILSPRLFKIFVMPYCQRLFENIPLPKVLHICGSTNSIVEYMMECGADALSFDQKTDIAKTREILGKEALILGNLDPYNLLALGSQEEIRETIRHCIDAGISAIWPGDDIWPEAPDENIRAMIETTRGTKKD
jgi:[methyl-Co(III) methanol-specific corrinoid protein]:coenzyme M methyltransferase